jgi:3-phenylpropionate/trans-cinnamate dioxygenase ferredoxin reductase subunit
VVVDTALRTSVGGVYAAGDVAQTPDPLWGGKPRLHPGWSLSEEQGKLAAEAIAGLPAGSRGAVSSNSLQVFDMGLTSVGAVQPETGDVVFTRHEPERRLYRKCVVRGGALAGCVVVDPSLPRKQVKKRLVELIVDGSGLGVDADDLLGAEPEFFLRA